MITADTIRQALACGEHGCTCGQPKGLVHCPGHEDRVPSLSVSQAGEKILVRCFGGCEQARVIDALKARDLWPSRNGDSPQAQKPRIVAIYNYRDVAGKLVFQVVRREPKDFRQRRPDGKGGWIWNMTGVDRVPYNLAEVLNSETIAVCEGEKDCDALVALGFAATTNPGGAGKWRKEYNQYFQGRKVVVFVDNDDPGRAHAEDVARNLYGVATIVKVLELSGLPEKGDICDWLKAGGTADQLQAIVKAAAEWDPREAPKASPQSISSKSEASKTAQSSVAIETVSGPPTWPREVMAGAAGNFSKTYAAYLETPESFLYMDYLTVLGHVVSSNITLHSEIRPEPRMYTINLGESADTRKSTSVSKTCGFFSEILDRDVIHEVLGVGSAEGLAKAFKRNPRVLLVSDELNALVQKMRIDASVLSPCICTLFESNRFHSLTKKHEINIDVAELTMLAACTLDTYRGMFTSQFLDIGLLNRFFVVIGDSNRKFAIPQPIPDQEKEALRRNLMDVLSFVEAHSQGGRYAMQINSTARDIFEKWYFGLEQSVFTKRLDTYGHRLMPLLAINELQHIITPEIAEKTVALLNYQLAARKYADPIDADNAIAKVEERIRRLLANGPMKKRDLELRANKHRVGIYLWNSAVKNLMLEEIIFDRSQKVYSRIL